MASIGSWWVKGFGRRPDEEVIGGFYANHLRRDDRPLGGKLYVTNERLLFCPHLLDALLGGSRTMIPVATVVAADRFDPSTAAEEDDVVGGGTQERLRLRLHDAGDEYFVVNDLDGVLDATRGVLESSGDTVQDGAAETDADEPV